MYNPLSRWKQMGRHRHLRRARWPMHKLVIIYLLKAALVFTVCSPIYLLYFTFHIIGYIAEKIIDVTEYIPNWLFSFLGGIENDDRFDEFLSRERRWKRRVLNVNKDANHAS